MSLNKQQIEAVETVDGPLLILAGAGSGKTTVLVNRIENLINNRKIDPENILAVTFQNKAAKEMTNRVLSKIIHPNINAITLSTFHSLCLNILKNESFRTDEIGFNFKIYDPDDCLTLLKQCIKQLGYQYSKKNKDNYVNPASMLTSISTFKNEMVNSKCLINETKENDYQDWDRILQLIESYVWEELEILHKVYAMYEEEMKRLNAIDFDDFLFKTVRIFLKHPNILKYYQSKFRYIMIDEYQDVNRVQYTLAKLLASKHRNLAVVGDDYQGIFGWRGADIRGILSFDKEYPDAKIVKLEQNYRSTKRIIQAANEVISNNVNQKHKKLFTTNDIGEKINLYCAYSEHNEAAFVARKIEEMRRKKGYEYGDFAILYRSNKKSAIIESKLTQEMIPNKVLSGKSFFDRSEIKDLMYYLKFIDSPDDPIFMRRIINTPKRGIGDATVEKIQMLSQTFPLFSILGDPKDLNRVNQNTKLGLNDFYKLISKFYEMKKRTSVSKLIEALVKELDLVNTVYFSDDKKKRKDRSEAIEQFIVISKEMDKERENLTLNSFVEELLLDSSTKESEEGFVKLMTMHASKGLEFPVVFLIGFDSKSFPSLQSKTPNELEEERRLCYVGITRAKKELFITYSGTLMVRNKQGFLEEKNVGMSKFLNEFDFKLVDVIETGYF
ncbi:UvrD-helicase domain-containing protein [Bacillus mexicanus]|uniref:ATP-dependent helicase n=1 Tax=Bacillus mexicanus TaxID=2834415 RepID=UPI003D234D74